MRISFEPALIDKVVMAKLDRGESPELVKEYRHMNEQIYLLKQEQRQEAIQSMHSYYFLRWGMKEAVKNILDEFPQFANRIEDVLVKGVDGNEGCFLNDEQTKIFIRLRPEQFENIAKLSRFLRHELIHISDILDEGFGCPKDAKPFDQSPTENIIRDRYALLWNIYIDGRLSRAEKDGITSQDSRKEQFHSAFRKLPANIRDNVFDSIYNAKHITHPELLKWAKEPAGLIEKFANEKKIDVILPGSPCPLCSFPTYSWVTNGRLIEKVVELISSDFPSWSRKQGVCDRCVELYEVRAGVW